MNMRHSYLLGFITYILISTATYGQNTLTLETTTLTERDLATGLTIPWEIKWGPDDHIWITERPGRIKRVNPISGNLTTVLDHVAQVENDDASGGSEYGMLGMAFHPEWEDTPKIFVVYTYAQGFSIEERLSAFTWDGESLINEEVLLDDIPGGSTHDGSRLLITTDQKILMTVGDRGSPNLGQDLNSINGKIIRLNFDGSIPDDNPISGSYIYSYGHRNPQGLTYGKNEIIYSSEHGFNDYDELNIVEPNRNYGWPNVEGVCNTPSEIAFCNANNVREPLAEWSPCVAVNDLHYYSHPAIPEWDGKLLMAVLGGFAKLPRVSVFTLSDDGLSVIEEQQYFQDFGRIRDICSNPETGAIYFATNGPNYPGSGPNRIVEYFNFDYIIDNVPELDPDQFVTIYPNPVVDYLQIEVSESFVGQEVQLIAFTGSLEREFTIKATTEKIDVSDLPVGQYYISVANDKGLITKVFVKD